jgi:hypothetical protein
VAVLIALAGAAQLRATISPSSFARKQPYHSNHTSHTGAVLQGAPAVYLVITAIVKKKPTAACRLFITITQLVMDLSVNEAFDQMPLLYKGEN